MRGLLDGLRGAMGPDAGLKMSAIGDTLIGLGQGQQMQSPAYNALIARQQRAEQMRALEDSGLFERFTPEQRQVLAMMEPGAAQEIIAGTIFREPERVQPIEINGQLVDPTTMQVLGDFRTPEGPRPNVTVVTSAADKAQWGLPDDGKPYEVEYDPTTMQLRNVSAIGGGNVTIGGGPQVVGNTGFVAVPDDSVEGGVRFVAAPNSPAEREAITAERGIEGQVAMASQMSDVIQQVIDDPALDSITGGMQGRLPAGIPLVTGGQAGANLQPKIDQISGGAFLQAIDQLRGMGALSNMEGQTATAAIARLSRIQDADEYRKALRELQALIDGGIERLKSGKLSTADAVDDLTPEERAYLGLE